MLFPQKTVNVRVKDKRVAREDAGVQAACLEAERIINGNGRVLLRESGTEPVIRIMIESESEALCDELCTKIAEAVKAGGHCSE
jgi:phosphoglucosamine mutase